LRTPLVERLVCPQGQEEDKRWTVSEADLPRQAYLLLKVMTFIDEWQKFSPYGKMSCL